MGRSGPSPTEDKRLRCGDTDGHSLINGQADSLNNVTNVLGHPCHIHLPQLNQGASWELSSLPNLTVTNSETHPG